MNFCTYGLSPLVPIPDGQCSPTFGSSVMKVYFGIDDYDQESYLTYILRLTYKRNFYDTKVVINPSTYKITCICHFFFTR